MVICAICNKKIVGTVISALKNDYHPECFVCTQCGKPITEKFQVKDGKPYCFNDFAELFSPRCFTCGLPITDTILKAMGHDWHHEHFVCSNCGAPLGGQEFLELDNKPVCQTCYLEKAGYKCKICGHPISDKVIVALGEKWHPECFKCYKCDAVITDDMFQVENDKPICQKCAEMT
nr:leupaxin-like [Onthophagus taurus]